jgi:hypothetical protein
MIKFHPRWQVYVIFLVIWLLGASYVLGFWNYLNPPGEWKTITNDLYHFSIEYPTKWSARTYGEHGFKGGDEIKLQIYRSWTGYFVIAVRQRDAVDPNVNDVTKWGADRIKSINRNMPRSHSVYQELSFERDYISGNQVLIRRYGNGEIMNEDVYIARENDMIIITLQAEADTFDQYLEDFYRIVESFHTVE